MRSQVPSFPSSNVPARRPLGTVQIAVTVACIAVFVVVTSRAARAAATCASVGANVNITLASGDTVTIARDAAGNFSVSGTGLTPTTCGGATVSNRDTVNITGTGGNESVTIDLSGGAFVPGMVDEAGATDEIEFAVNLGAGAADAIVITGLPTADTITVGESGVNLNDVDDVDVSLVDVEARTISGSGGDDIMSAAGGNATGAALVSTVTINGGNNADTIAGGDSGDTLNGESGDDAISGGPGPDTSSGGIGNDVFDEGSGINGADSFAGGTGLDGVTYAARTAAVTVTIDGVSDDGEAGEGDSIATDVENAIAGSGSDVLVGSSSPNSLSGGAGDDTIDGAAGVDIIDGGDDADEIIGGNGNDGLAGGSGTDVADYTQSTSSVTVNLLTGMASGAAGMDTLATFEDVSTGTGADFLTGDAGPNQLDGGAGNDSLAGGQDDDTLTGGGGTDLADFTAVSGDLAVNLVLGTATGDGNDTLVAIANVTGGSGTDVIVGSSVANTLDGGSGNDSLDGGGGNDALVGGTGVDTVQYGAAPGDVTVNLSAGTATGYGTDTLTGIQHVVAGVGNDSLTGNAAGNDLTGGAGNDTMNGGAGNDSLSGGAGSDTASFATNATGIVADLVAGNASGDGSDTLTGFEELLGGSGPDTLAGDGGLNLLDGGAGNDVVSGAGANDTLTGGAGIDTLDMSSASADVVVNVSAGSASGQGADLFTGFEDVVTGTGSDTLIGDGAANLLNGGAGGDLIVGGLGDDIMNGGTGTDRVEFQSATVGVTVDLTAGTAAGEGNDSLQGFENVTGSGFSDVSRERDGPASPTSSSDPQATTS